MRVVLALAPEHGVPVLEMREELTVFHGLDNPNRWQGPFRGSLVRWKAADGEAIIRALQDAKANPVERPLGRLGKSHAKAVTQHEAAQSAASRHLADTKQVAYETRDASRSVTSYSRAWLHPRQGVSARVRCPSRMSRNL